jgi:hypothetical protein
MYSTCIFCTRSLGHNEALEHFPVGRRLAFDAAKGRLWVICVSCRRWNLTPLEERWEAVEEAERLFRSTPLRVSTDHIGLARVADGTDLVRIGSPQRPELAAWRYGTQFAKRRHARFLTFGAAFATGGVAVAGGYFGGGAAVAVALIGAQVLYKFAEEGGMNAIGRLREPGGHIIQVTRQHLKLTTIGVGSDGGLALDVEHGEQRSTHFEGMHARRAATTLFPMVNHLGGTADDVQLALKRLIHAGSAEKFLSNLARRGAQLPTGRSEYDYGSFETRLNAVGDTGLLALPTTLGLAIEMALHDEQERAALEGELADLEDAWRDAEEIGAIADGMFLPSAIEQALTRLRLR